MVIINQKSARQQKCSDATQYTVGSERCRLQSTLQQKRQRSFYALQNTEKHKLVKNIYSNNNYVCHSVCTLSVNAVKLKNTLRVGLPGCGTCGWCMTTVQSMYFQSPTAPPHRPALRLTILIL